MVSWWVRCLWPLSWKKFLGTFFTLQGIITEFPSWGGVTRDGSTLLLCTPRPVPRRTFAGGSDEIIRQLTVLGNEAMGSDIPFSFSNQSGV